VNERERERERERGMAFIELRKQAEKMLAGCGYGPKKSDDPNVLNLLQELEVHQVELELQNDELRQLQKDLEASRNEYLSLYNSAPVGFVTVNSEGRIVRANPEARELLAGPKGFLAGEIFIRLIDPVDWAAYNQILQKIRPGTSEVFDLRMYGKHGGLFHARIQARYGRDEGDGSRLWYFAVSDISKEKEAEAVLRRSNDELNRLVRDRSQKLRQRTEQLSRFSSQLTLAEQRERRRLGKIIHDHLQQLLVGTKIQLEILAEKIGNDRKQDFEKVHKLLLDSIATSRSLSAQLTPHILYERGLGPGLEWLAQTMADTYRLDIEVRVDPNVSVESEDLKVLLFESVRELLFNVVKHARTSSARIHMSMTDDDLLQITVSDEGTGFHQKETLKNLFQGDRFGLFSIRERLELLGGSMTIDSSPANGTNIHLRVPAGKAVSTDEHREKTRDLPCETVAAPAPKGSKIRVLLVDDHVILRQGLSTMLERQSDIVVAGEAADGEEAVQKARQLHPDVILMDVSMPKMSGMEATRLIHTEAPRIRIIGLSMYDDIGTNRAMLDAGAVALMSKSGRTDDLLTVIRGGIDAGGAE
jgi:PAS domain S-box-containing protein